MSTWLGIKTSAYPLDPPTEVLSAPYPPYPNSQLFSRWISREFFNWTLHPALPLGFSLVYYILSHYANRIVQKHGNVDYTKGNHFSSRVARLLILAHNAFLAIYSGWTWVMMFSIVVDFFVQGWRVAGLQGVNLALCSMPTNRSNLGRYTYLFYISKYYEVIDSVILLVKGKKVSNLQSYHHAGAIICMWIAYRYQSQPVWVFCVFNSFVHTLMYSYYFCSAMHWPFPRALKRNLTTLQIAQIASGTLLTNLYLMIRLQPWVILSNERMASFFNNLGSETDLYSYAIARNQSSDPTTCLETTGAELALHVNTMYMFPLLALFFRFFVRSYLGRGQAKSKASDPNHAKVNGELKKTR